MDINLTLPNNWDPRPDQEPVWDYLQNGGKRAVQVAHRRWGKDDIALHYTATAQQQRVGNYWHMLPRYEQARKVIWNAINPRTGLRRIDEAFPEPLRKKTLDHQMMIEFESGSIWQLVGSDNYDSIVGAPPVGITFSEWAIANPMAWPYLEPILVENNGWALFIYTSRGNNHGKTMYNHAVAADGWFSSRMAATETPVFTEQQLSETRDGLVAVFGYELGMALYEQEYLCSWEGAVFGAYYAKQIRDARADGRITSVPHQAGHEVETFWDLGVDDSMSIWFMQASGKAYHFIDYYESQGYGLEHYAKVLKGKPYVYGSHGMPHDAEIREMTNAEIAKSRKEVAEDLGIKPIEIVQRARNMDTIIQVHIPAVRNMIEQSWFDERKCEKGIACLENYRANYDEEKKVLTNKPLHDWSCHGADAFRTFAMGWKAKIDMASIQPGQGPRIAAVHPW